MRKRLTAAGLPGFEIAFLLSLPILLTLLARSWLFLAPDRWIDPYIYTGYFLRLDALMDRLGATYYASRLPWLLLGNALYRLTTPEIANLLLRFILFYGGTFGLYATVRTLWRDRMAAAVAATLLGLHGWFIFAIRWDYPDGAACVLLLWELFCLAQLSRGPARPSAWSAAAGALAVTAFSTHIFLLTLMPGVLVWYALLARRNRTLRIVKDPAFFLAGALAALVVFAVVNAYLSGNFNYLQAQFHAASDIDQSHYRGALANWLPGARWLVMPLVGFAAACVCLLIAAVRGDFKRPRSLPDDYAALLITALLVVLTAAVFAYFQFLSQKSVPVMQFFYYASFYTPFAFLFIGGLLATAFAGVSQPWRRRLELAALVAPLVPWVVGAAGIEVAAALRFTGAPTLALIALTVALLALAATRRLAVLVLPAAVALVYLSAGAGRDLVPYGRADRAYDAFLLTFDLDSALAPYNQDGKLIVWYDAGQPLAGVYNAVQYTSLMERAVSSFPDDAAKINLGDRLAVFSPAGTPAAAASAVAAYDLTFRLLANVTVHHGTQDVQGQVLQAVELCPPTLPVDRRRPYAVCWKVVNVPPVMKGGSAVPAVMRLINAGRVAWVPAGGGGASVTYRWLDKDCRRVIRDGAVSVLAAAISPAGQLDADVSLVVPSTPGDYCLEFDAIANTVPISGGGEQQIKVTVVP